MPTYYINNWPGTWINASVTYTSATTSTYNMQVWGAWSQTATNTISVFSPTPAYKPLSAGEASRRKQTEYRRKRERLMAGKRAQELLLSILDERQRSEFREHRAVTVCSRSGRRYRVRHGWAGNVDEIIDGQTRAHYCIHPRGGCPPEDNMLAQVLLLTHDEEQFHRVANRTPVAA